MPARRVCLRIIFTALIALSLVSGCGYHPVVMRGPLAGANGVDVTLFVNKSYRPGLSAILARDLVDQFALRTGGGVLPADQAELELSGVILSYATVPVSYSALDTIKEYKTVISVQATLREKRTLKVLWKGELVEEQAYPVNANLALQQNAEEAATARISSRLSERIWQKTGERF